MLFSITDYHLDYEKRALISTFIKYLLKLFKETSPVEALIVINEFFRYDDADIDTINLELNTLKKKHNKGKLILLQILQETVPVLSRLPP